MKSQTTKKLFAFIIIMMFFSLTQLANAQVHPDLNGGGGGYFCYCANIKVGCRGNVNCVVFCTTACKPKTIKIIRNPLGVTSFTTIYPNAVSPSIMNSFVLHQSEEMNSLKLPDNKKNLLKLYDNSETQLIQRMEWDTPDINSLNSISN